MLNEWIGVEGGACVDSIAAGFLASSFSDSAAIFANNREVEVAATSTVSCEPIEMKADSGLASRDEDAGAETGGVAGVFVSLACEAFAGATAGGTAGDAGGTAGRAGAHDI